MNRFVLMMPLALAVSGCAGGQKSIDRAGDVATDIIMPVPQENELGKKLIPEIEKDLKLHTDAALQSYVSELGRKITSAAREQTPEGINFTFKVVDDDETVNAFAIPGGTIYVYSGLLKLADDEAEVLGVLGHEVAHVTQRHVARRLIAAYGIEAITGIVLGENGGDLAKMAAQLAGAGAMLKFGRDQERESDATGIPWVVRAGYDPGGVVTFFEKLKAQQGAGSELLVLIQSHPLPSERVDNAKAQIAELRNVPNKRGAETYQKKTEALRSGKSSAPSSSTSTSTTTEESASEPSTTRNRDRTRSRTR